MVVNSERELGHFNEVSPRYSSGSLGKDILQRLEQRRQLVKKRPSPTNLTFKDIENVDELIRRIKGKL